MEGWFATDADSISLKGWDQVCSPHLVAVVASILAHDEIAVLLCMTRLWGAGGAASRWPWPHGSWISSGYKYSGKRLRYTPQPQVCICHFLIHLLSNCCSFICHSFSTDPSIFFRVVEIVRHRNRVEVTVSSGKTFVADAAVVAVPLGVLKANTIKFEPRLPEWKEEAVRELSVGIENKIVLHFSQVFWPNVEFLGVVSSSTYGCSYFLNLHKATGYPVLVYMPAGRLARDIEKMSDETAAQFAFSQLKKILPNAAEPVSL